MIEQFPNLKCIFPEAPILSFRRNKNLRNQLVHTSLTVGTQKTSEQSGYSTPCLSKRGKGCRLCPFMSNTNVITNSHTNLAIRLGVNVPPQTPFMQQSAPGIA